MMRQLTALFAKMGNFGGGTDVVRRPLRPVTTTIMMMRRRRRRRRTAVRLWEEKEEEGECKNHTRHCCHYWDEGGPHKGHERQMLHHIDMRWEGDKALGKGGAQKSLLLLDGGANTTITIATGNSTSSGTGYIEEDGRVQSSWCRRKGQR